MNLNTYDIYPSCQKDFEPIYIWREVNFVANVLAHSRHQLIIKALLFLTGFRFIKEKWILLTTKNNNWTTIIRVYNFRVIRKSKRKCLSRVGKKIPKIPNCNKIILKLNWKHPNLKIPNHLISDPEPTHKSLVRDWDLIWHR